MPNNAKSGENFVVTNGNLSCEVTWEEVENLIVDLAQKMILDNFKPDIIVAILRGGMVPARLLCNYFDKASLFTVSAKLYDKVDDWQTEAAYMHSVGAVQVGELNLPIYGKKNIVVVDDISDSGETFTAVLEEIHNKYQTSYDDGKMRTASLYVRESSNFIPSFYGEKVNHKIWFDFPWEKKNKY